MLWLWYGMDAPNESIDDSQICRIVLAIHLAAFVFLKDLFGKCSKISYKNRIFKPVFLVLKQYFLFKINFIFDFEIISKLLFGIPKYLKFKLI